MGRAKIRRHAPAAGQMRLQRGRSPWRPAAAMALAAVILAGCGGGAREPSAAAQRNAVRATLATFLRELSAGHGQIACEGLTAAGASSVIGVIGPELGNFGIDSCAQVVQVTGSQLTPALRRELASVRIGAVALHGSSATVAWSAITSPGGDLGAYFGHPRPVRFAYLNRFWYISSL
jgi:hypothetical protein